MDDKSSFCLSSLDWEGDVQGMEHSYLWICWIKCTGLLQGSKCHVLSLNVAYMRPLLRLRPQSVCERQTETPVGLLAPRAVTWGNNTVDGTTRGRRRDWRPHGNFMWSLMVQSLQKKKKKKSNTPQKFPLAWRECWTSSLATMKDLFHAALRFCAHMFSFSQLRGRSRDTSTDLLMCPWARHHTGTAALIKPDSHTHRKALELPVCALWRQMTDAAKSGNW